MGSRLSFVGKGLGIAAGIALLVAYMTGQILVIGDIKERDEIIATLCAEGVAAEGYSSYVVLEQFHGGCKVAVTGYADLNIVFPVIPVETLNGIVLRENK